MTTNTTIWFNDPSILLNKSKITQIWPSGQMSRNEKINSITRLVIILSILGYLLTNSVNFFLSGLITLGVINTQSVDFTMVTAFVLGVSLVFVCFGFIINYINENILNSEKNIKRVFTTAGIASILVGTNMILG